MNRVVLFLCCMLFFACAKKEEASIIGHWTPENGDITTNIGIIFLEDDVYQFVVKNDKDSVLHHITGSYKLDKESNKVNIEMRGNHQENEILELTQNKLILKLNGQLGKDIVTSYTRK